MNAPQPTRIARVVVNPAARHAALFPLLEIGHPFRTVIEHASGKDLAAAIMQSSARRGELVVVAGGDGSLHAAVNALGDVDATIGLVPLGTANDFARDTGLPLDPVNAAVRIANGRAHALDMLSINGTRCAGGGGIGLPGLCLDTVDELRSHSAFARALVQLAGDRIYQAATALHLVPTPPRLHLHATWTTPAGHERSWTTVVAGAFFLNQPTIGSGLPISPNAVRDDGVFELCFIRSVSTSAYVRCLLRLARGIPDDGQVVVVVGATRARLELSSPVAVFADGERLPAARVVDVALLPGALSLVH
ncbi:MAG: diacylglycerol kinase family protein [Deltaproteobacteria bacterium]|nr:diacylglycerol kinase family protein [Deltaproteobacteria bacterium]